MRNLILFRHAKAKPGNGLQDFDRTLADKGRDDAREMGRWLEQNGLHPHFALVSSARRTRETWDLAAGAIDSAAELHLEQKLYEASAPQILACIQGAPESAACVVVVGHNPGLEDLAGRLAHIGSGAARQQLQEGFSPGSIAVFSITADSWSNLTLDHAELVHFITPKLRKAAN